MEGWIDLNKPAKEKAVLGRARRRMWGRGAYLSQ